MTKGVYFSANDQVFPWVLGFLRSFRIFNPELPLYLIPFDDNCDKVLSLRDTYNFKVYIDESFTELEALGTKFELGHTSYGPYWFRRYAALWGPLDYFLYSDTRSIVLANLEPVLELLMDQSTDFIYYDQAIDQVYNQSAFRKKLCIQGKAKGFLSGFWGTNNRLYSRNEILKLGYEAIEKHRGDLNPRNTDQAFINYCIDHKNNLNSAKISELLGDTSHTAWAGQRGKVYKKGRQYYLWDYGGLDHKKHLIYLHWAGYHWEDLIPQAHILNRFVSPGLLTSVKRLLNGLKRYIKSRFWIRKVMSDV